MLFDPYPWEFKVMVHWVGWKLLQPMLNVATMHGHQNFCSGSEHCEIDEESSQPWRHHMTGRTQSSSLNK